MIVFLQTECQTERLHYAAYVIFEIHLGMEIQYVEKIPEELPNDTVGIYYGKSPKHKGQLKIWEHGILNEKGILEKQLINIQNSPHPHFFECPDQGLDDFDLPFDIFSFVFYLLSRYEEYLPFPGDRFGRFHSGLSTAAKGEFLDIPLVDLWINKFGEIIKQVSGWPGASVRGLVNQPTIDVDMPYAYMAKGWKNGLGLLKDLAHLSPDRIRSRVNYLRKGIDPFDTYESMRSSFETNGLKPIFFFLMRYMKPYDENHLCESPLMEDLAAKIGRYAELGIHPSVYSFNNRDRIIEEMDRFRQINGNRAYRSRQHFLYLRFPQTYQVLCSLGIKEDHSMIYADHIGFRASTSKVFPWYDLENEKITDLQIHPACVMDVTLRYYMNLDPHTGAELILNLSDQVRMVGGNFTWIWHNSSFSRAYGWKQWASCFELCCSV